MCVCVCVPIHIQYAYPHRIIREYVTFKTRSLTEPADSKEMMELISYMEESKTTLVKTLEQDVQSSLKRLGYLLDVYNFTAVDMELNQSTLTWPKRLDPIFEQNEQVI